MSPLVPFPTGLAQQPPLQTFRGTMTFVGAGPFSATGPYDAAHNYGFPQGTEPDPMANPPAPKDVYMDTTNGDITVLTGTGPVPTTARGTVTFVGDGPFAAAGPYDAAHNYGFPQGTEPDPIQNPPAPNDVYMDTVGGDITVLS